MIVQLLLWVVLFLYTSIPGMPVGYLIATLPVSLAWLVFLSLYVAALASYLISLVVVPSDVITNGIHAAMIVLFGPPIFAAILLGSLAKRYRRQDDRPR